MRFLTAVLIAAVLLLAPAAEAWAAEKRVALVIGNGAYKSVPALPNPKNDAASVEAMLKAARFDRVVRVTDLGVSQLKRALRDFSDEARDADIAVVFYAGHGMEMNGTNYLIPVDAVLERDIDVEDEAVTLDRVYQVLEQAKRLRLIVLDACRDNPFVRSMKRTLAGRSIGRGLAKVDVVSSDTLIAYAAKAGSTAADGDGANSPYTTALVKHLMTPGLDVRLALGRVRDEVLRSTRNRQEPFVYGSLGGSELPLVPGAPTAQPQQALPSVEHEAAAAWASIKDTSSTSELDAFIRRFGATFHGDLARSRLAELQRLAMLADEDARRRREDEAAKRKAAEAERKAAEEAARRKPALSVKPGSGESFRDCPDCPEMIVVPAGSFMMGSPDSEQARTSDEGPQRRVTIAKPFAIGKFEVTVGEYLTCVAAQSCRDPEWQEKGSSYNVKTGSDGHYKTLGAALTGKTYPIVGISWNDAQAFAKWVASKTGQPYRLLTEAEWEYAARAGTTTPFHFGATISTDQANYDGNYTYGSGKKGADRQKTIEVGSLKKPNAFGLHDMHGNVWEWVEDCYADSYKGAPTDGSKAPDTKGCSRVLRGGSWSDDPQVLRSADRDWGRPGDRSYGHQGFRLARTLPHTP